jgi:GDP-mannose 6-dehydrogenase
MIKYACNAFHAVKICFANEIGSLSERLGVDGHEVMRTFCRDARLNISPAYLRPGFSFGGSCLPKDLRALVYRASRLDLELPLLASAMPSNSAHLKRAVDAILNTGARRIGVMGLTFKENTDDLRESPVITLLEFLIGKGLEVRIFDPQISVDTIYGSNREFLLNAIPHIGRLIVSSPGSVASWADCLVVTQKPTAAVLDAIDGSAIPVIDVAGVLTKAHQSSKERASV